MAELDLDALEKEQAAKNKKENKEQKKRGAKPKEEPMTKVAKPVKTGKLKIDPTKPKGTIENPYTIEEQPDAPIVRCANCSTESGGQVYLSWNQLIKMNDKRSRTAVKCPYCETALGIWDKTGYLNPEFKIKNPAKNTARYTK